MRKRNSVIAALLAVAMIIAMMPVVAQEAWADTKEVNFIPRVSGLYKGKIVLGTVITLNGEEICADNSEMMEDAMTYGGIADVYLHTHSPSDNMHFDYDSSNGNYTLLMPDDFEYIGHEGNIIIDIGLTQYTTPLIKIVDKFANTLSVKGKTATVYYSKLKKRTQYLPASRVYNFKSKGQGTKKYTLSSARKSKKSYKKHFKVNTVTGKITVKKGTRKGLYILKVKIRANGTTYYKPSATKTVTVKIRVK